MRWFRSNGRGLLFFAACAAAFSQPLPLGTAKVVSSVCEKDAGPLANTTCKTILVSYPRIIDLKVFLRISEPAKGVPFLGTVVFGTGGPGTDFNYDQSPPLMANLQKAGYRLVQRAWEVPWGMGAGELVGAGRYSTLLTWIRSELGGSGAFCATGNSNGGTELLYAMARYGRDEILDFAAPTSTPWTTRLDWTCDADPNWPALCKKIPADAGLKCEQQACGVDLDQVAAAWFVGAAGYDKLPCAAARKGDPEGIRFLLNESLLAPASRLNYPRTPVHFLFGAKDCGMSVPFGLKFAAAVTSKKTITIVPTAGHGIFGDPGGNAALQDAILKNCTCGH